MKKNLVYAAFILLSMLLLGACSRKTPYERLAHAGLESGVKNDSLFLGYYLGMTRQDFYKHSWQLNKQKKVTNGSSNLSVLHYTDELPHPAKMNFFPNFHNERIYQMPVRFSYPAWAPWNRNLFADSLQLALVHLYRKRYGNDFITLKDHKGHPVYIQIDGNLRIALFWENDQMVDALFTDLDAERRITGKVMNFEDLMKTWKLKF